MKLALAILALVPGLSVCQTEKTWPSCYIDDKNCDGVNFSLVPDYGMAHATLDGASFVGSDWQGTTCGGSTAVSSDFTNADFSGAAANHIDFAASILINVNFMGANLQHTSFKKADMTGATFDDSTDVTSASFNGTTTFPDGNYWNETSFFTNDLKNMKLHLDNEDISNLDYSPTVDPRFADFAGASFLRTNATGCTFHGNNFSPDAYLQVINAQGADFTGSNLSGVTSQYANFQDAIFHGVNMVGMKVQESDFRAADMTGAILDGTTIVETAKINGFTTFPDGKDWKGTSFFTNNLRGMKLYLDYEDISNLDFSASIDDRYADLSKSSFHATIAHGAKFRGNNLRNVWMQTIKATGIDFTDSDLSGVTSQWSNLAGAIFTNANLDRMDVKNTDLTGCNIVGADLTGIVYNEDTKFSSCTYSTTTKFAVGFDTSELVLVDDVQVHFIFPLNKALDLQPSSTLGFTDISSYDPDPTFSVPSSYNVYYYTTDKTESLQEQLGLEATGKYDEVVPPNYYNDANCSPPADSISSSWPANGCICFEPDLLQTSFYDMSPEAQDVPTNAFGYRTAFDTSVTGGVTVAGWFKASDTSGEPINAAANRPGIQYSHILTRGQLASWGAGFNFGMGKDTGFRFEVVLNGGRLTAQSPTNTWYPGIDIWHYVVGTYNAEQGRVAMYVDNVLQGVTFADSTWTRAQRDIKWGTNEAQAGKTRIGNGYDASDKNFFGCTAGLTLFGGATSAIVTDAPTSQPTSSPTKFPTEAPTNAPSKKPTSTPTPDTVTVEEAMSKCEASVESACGTDTKNYGKFVSCLARTVRREQDCSDAVAISEDNGIGHIISHESAYWRQNRGKRLRRRRQQEVTSLCGDAAFSNCGGVCVEFGSVEEEGWFSCLDEYIYSDNVQECNHELTDEFAWETIGLTCGFYSEQIFN